MSDIPTTDWSEVAANNIQPSPAGWPPNSSPNIVYTTDREMMGAIKREFNRGNATVTSTGSANAQVLTYTSPPTAMVRGMRFAFIAGFANTGATTIAISPLAPIAVQVNGAALNGGELKVGLISELLYDGTNFQLIAGSGGGMPLSGGTFTGNVTIGTGSPGGAALALNSGPAGGDGIFGNKSGVVRWAMLLGNATAETGGNSGSDFALVRYTDAGAGIDSPLAITRSTGAATFSNTVTAIGYATRAGISGAYGGNNFDFNWSGGAMQGWVDATNLGNISFVSDYRAKRDVSPLLSMWERTKALKPISYRHKDFSIIKNDDVERWGFVAHELQETLIEDAASGHKDEENLIQAPNPWTVIATLTKALQEAMARIEVLEAKAAALPA